MIQEHAITYEKDINLSHIDYLCNKANKLGLEGRKILRVHEQADLEGKHIYFDVEGGKFEQGRDA